MRLAKKERLAARLTTFCTMEDSATEERTRLDKWLWAARFFKTRGLAAEAIAGGKVQVNGERVKRSKVLRLSDEVRVRQGPYELRVVVRGLSDRRGPAEQALLLYEETVASRTAREKMALQLKSLHSAFAPDRGRPTKKDRREMEKLKKRER
ncbi:MAG TPA: S4 domain-containing protein [Gemmatimonadales bacterium]|nr:S4 domain-containing protein [Gemmatimonadales bacterium]